MDSVTPPSGHKNAPASVRPTRGGRGRGALFLAAAPVVLLLLCAALWRGLTRPPGAQGTGQRAAPLTPGELSALNAARLQTDQSDAYQDAQKEVRAFLLSREARTSAQFPAHLTSRNVTIEKRSPTRFRVRGVVEWRPAKNSAEPATQTRRFEADLLHGPADNRWHLIDTEFLDDAHSDPVTAR